MSDPESAIPGENTNARPIVRGADTPEAGWLSPFSSFLSPDRPEGAFHTAGTVWARSRFAPSGEPGEGCGY
jgi:hypothetical protein